jgi:hypothetical protein
MILPLTIRASSADRTFSCHGSLLAVPLIPVNRRNDGDEGEFIHYCIAEIAIRVLGATPPEGGLRPPALGKDYKLPAFSAWMIDWGVERIKELIPADWSLMVEVPLAYRYDLPRPVWVPVDEITGPIPADHEVVDGRVCIRYVIISGHIDVLGLSPDGKQSVAIDWKSGQVGAEPAETNWQAGVYLGLKKRAWPELDPSKFVMAQPMVDEDSSGIPRLSHAELDGAGLDRMNAELAEQACKALEDRYTTDSGKQCRWCPVALSRRAVLCPSIAADTDFMKANLSKEKIEALRKDPDDALLGDFVLTWRRLDAPGKAATEYLHERLDAQGYVDAGCGSRITVSIKKGDITIKNKSGYREDLEKLVPDTKLRDECTSYSKDAVISAIAKARGIPKDSTKPEVEDAVGLYEDRLARHTEQGKRRLLVVT